MSEAGRGEANVSPFVPAWRRNACAAIDDLVAQLLRTRRCLSVPERSPEASARLIDSAGEALAASAVYLDALLPEKYRVPIDPCLEAVVMVPEDGGETR